MEEVFPEGGLSWVPVSEQVKASWAEGTAWTKIRRQEPARRMLTKGTEGMGRGWGGPPQTKKGPGRQAIGHRECSAQEKSTTCTLRLDGAGLEAEAGKEATPWTDTRGLVSLKGGLMPSHLFTPPSS